MPDTVSVEPLFITILLELALRARLVIEPLPAIVSVTPEHTEILSPEPGLAALTAVEQLVMEKIDEVLVPGVHVPLVLA